MREIMVALSQSGHRVIRVNAGQGWAGHSRRMPDGSVVIKHAQPFYGVPEGVSDLIGVATDGRFIALEVKQGKGRPTDRQTAYVAMVNAMGGRAGVVWSVDDALAIATPPPNT
jgi:hypothetical protein